MKTATVEVSSSFKKMATRAILSIILFIVTYILLMGFGIGLAMLCAYGAIGIIAAHPSLAAILMALGLFGCGGLVLMFLVKFMFKTHKIDRSNLIEITAKEEPELFALIKEVVEAVDTDFPKKVYLSADVNACVFYDSSFWSMFFPIRKNLQLGLGLINSTTVDEFKAVLAHEFGHFSQRSMKVGSYVYNVNQVIHNILYDNDSFEELARNLAGISDITAIFVMLAFKIAQAIQWILHKVYYVVNLSYMSLSREMEFHADAVAAHVTGSAALERALLRLDLVGHAYGNVLEHYQSKFEDAVVTNNLYPQHAYVVDFLAKESEIPFESQLPQVQIAHLNRYNKSKLNIENQWASHPSTPDRVAALQALNVAPTTNQNAPAFSLFKNPAAIQERLTKHLFSFVKYSKVTTSQDSQAFINAYTEDYADRSFDKIFNGYYDDKHVLTEIPEETTSSKIKELNVDDLYGIEKVNLVYTMLSLEKDMEVLEQIKTGDVKINSFDYDGQKYKKKDCTRLLKQLNADYDTLKKQLHEHDVMIYHYFRSLAEQRDELDIYMEKYEIISYLDKKAMITSQPYAALIQAFEFMNHDLSYEDAEHYMREAKKVEQDYRQQVEYVLATPVYHAAMTDEVKALFQEYLSTDLVYLKDGQYNDLALEKIDRCLKAYYSLMSNVYFDKKKDLLTYKATLLN